MIFDAKEPLIQEKPAGYSRLKIILALVLAISAVVALTHSSNFKNESAVAAVSAVDTPTTETVVGKNTKKKASGSSSGGGGKKEPEKPKTFNVKAEEMKYEKMGRGILVTVTRKDDGITINGDWETGVLFISDGTADGAPWKPHEGYTNNVRSCLQVLLGNLVEEDAFSQAPPQKVKVSGMKSSQVEKKFTIETDATEKGKYGGGHAVYETTITIGDAKKGRASAESKQN